MRRVASALILMRQEGERGIEIAWVTGRRGDRVLFFRLGRGVDEVSFVSYFKRNCLISSRQHLSRRWMRRRGEGYSHFRLRKKDESPLRGLSKSNPCREDTSYHQRSSQSSLSLPTHPPPPLALSFLLPSHSPAIHIGTCHSSALFKLPLLALGRLVFFHCCTSLLRYWTDFFLLLLPPLLAQLNTSTSRH